MTLKRLRKYNDKVEYVYKTSADAANLIPEGLDFVYIDGNHDYEYVKNDIANYFPKVKKGGVIGGNDFNCGNGVIHAVTEFTVANKFHLMVERNDWWLQK
jgi:hypothetical protein